MKKYFFVLLFFIGITAYSSGQIIETVKTSNSEKTPAIYNGNKLYYEKNYDAQAHIVFEGLKFNNCYLGNITWYWPDGNLKYTRRYLIDTPTTADLKRWEWLEHYRVWNAEKKIFEYPENWLESNPGDDKTPYLKELEKRGRCNIANGLWKSFDKNGKLISVVVYDKGKLIK